jgi:hypothetical protein
MITIQTQRTLYLTLLVIFESTSLQHRQAPRPKIPKAIETMATTLGDMVRKRGSLVEASCRGRVGTYKIALQ